ncbi:MULTISPECIES: fumarylacetoacetate hydrolase family protein [unclassified Aeromicrobium]|uniref:fumarylacetoacetate hydrolase family protein n=1 Tax=unclassified Aeromicrobium TaxID=2633570 RepID=UPI001910CA7A|nr:MULTISPECIES: fumarylacetoacetate hydrolase family protein [unclassified Aeromicrobium]
MHDVSDTAGRSGLVGLLPSDAQQRLADELEQHPVVSLTEATWLPPVPRPEHVVCVGHNFNSHAAEVGAKPTEHPTLFTRFASSFVGHEVPLVAPFVSDTLDWEGEVAVVIGDGGRHISRADAMSHVAGFSVMGENSVREFQLHSPQATAGKNFDGSGSWGPWIVTTDEVPDPAALEIVTRLEGVEVQRGSLANLTFDVSAVIAYVSAFVTLVPGDVVALGTPPGIGHRQDPPRYLQPGERLEVSIPGLLELRNVVRAEVAAP